jgi:hypothetical protein
MLDIELRARLTVSYSFLFCRKLTEMKGGLRKQE